MSYFEATRAIQPLNERSFDQIQNLVQMWHLQQQAHNSSLNRNPTPFSIDDILRPGEISRVQADQRADQVHGSIDKNGLYLPQLEAAFALHVASLATLDRGLGPARTSWLAQDDAKILKELPRGSEKTCLTEADDQPLNLSTTTTTNTSSTILGYSDQVKTPKTVTTRSSPSSSSNSSSPYFSSPYPFQGSDAVSHNFGWGSKVGGAGLKRAMFRDAESNLSPEDNLDVADRKRKKVRTTFTGRQIFELEKMFETKKYLSSSERSEMSKLLNVTEQQVKIWFQNRRTKWKKQDNVSSEEAVELMKAKIGKSTPMSGLVGTVVTSTISTPSSLSPPSFPSTSSSPSSTSGNFKPVTMPRRSPPALVVSLPHQTTQAYNSQDFGGCTASAFPGTISTGLSPLFSLADETGERLLSPAVSEPSRLGGSPIPIRSPCQDRKSPLFAEEIQDSSGHTKSNLASSLFGQGSAPKGNYLGSGAPYLGTSNPASV